MFRRLIITLALTLLACAPALAEQVKTFAVLPFQVHGPSEYKYLEKGIQSMLVSRMTWPGHFESVSQDKLASVSAPADRNAALSSLQSLGADYLVYGSTTIMGDQASLDVQVLDAAGKATPQSSQTSLSGLIPSLESTAKAINGQVFGRPEEKVAAPVKKIQPINPQFVVNETGADQFYITEGNTNPASATDSGRWRSQALNMVGLSMVVADGDSDGKNEIFILEEKGVQAFTIQQNKLVPLASYKASSRLQLLNLNIHDLNRDGYAEIIVSGIDEMDASSFILNFRDGRFQLVEDRIPFFLNLVKMPPLYSPTLIGQGSGKGSLFKRTVHEVVRQSGNYQLGRSIALPEKGNVFNVTYLPQKDDYKVIVADNHDHLRVNSSGNAIQATTDEAYAGTGNGIAVYETLPGLGVNKTEQDPVHYYIPSRLIPMDLDSDGTYTLLVNRNLSVSAQFFTNYRSFPQGELHNLEWDGIGLNTKWKTRRIKGTVNDYGIADIDQDGHDDLVVLVNTHPGMTGLKTQKTLVLAYPLDVPNH